MNRLKSLAELEHCSQLQALYCSQNLLTSLVNIVSCSELGSLDCARNRLVSLEGIECCLKLETLYCSNNQLTHVGHLVYLPHLSTLYYSGNPLEIQNIQIQRFLERFEYTYRFRTGSSIYSDRQTVHNTHIQKTVCESIRRLLSDSKPIFSIETIINSNLSKHTIELLVEYCADGSLHSVHLISYMELLSYVWARIERHEHRDELFRILAEQVNDSECKCFTGRFNRTLSVLVGFYDDIVIEISDSARIGAIILAIEKRLVPYDSKVYRETAYTELLAAGYTIEKIRPWLEAISEP